MRHIGHGPNVLDRARREEDVRRGDQRRPVVDRPRDGFNRDADPVGTLHHHHLHAGRALCQPLISDGGEVERGGDDFWAGRVVKGAGQDRGRGGNRGMEGNLVLLRANQGAIPGAKPFGCLEPHVVPRGGAPGVPEVEVLENLRARPKGKGAKRAGVEVDFLLEDRELGAITR